MNNLEIINREKYSTNSIFFLLGSMTFLKMYIPIIIEANKQNIKSTILYCKGSKKSESDKQCPIISLNKLKEYAILYNFSIDHINNLKNHNSILIDVEGSNYSNYSKYTKNNIIISITYCDDYTKLYYKYIDKIDFCIFNGYKFTTDYINFIQKNNFSKNIILNENKNLFIGSPKFEIKFNKKNIIQKYNLNDNNKYILFFLPKLRDLNIKNLNKILNFFAEKSYYLLLKTRNKDEYINEKNIFPKNSLYVNDTEWFPHPSLELIYISEFVFNFDSSGAIEAIMLEKHVINYNCKNISLLNEFLKNIWDEYIFFKNIDYLEEAYNNLLTVNKNKNNIKKFIKEYFSQNNCSKNIINLIKSL